LNNPILEEQIEYYRARAQEYDESITGAIELLMPAKDLLLKLGTFESILELACGTGIWTEVLLQMGNHVTAVDAALEMLAIARNKLGVERIIYQQTDLFQWVFFANWLSHVPPDGLDHFLEKVRRTVNPGGRFAMIDQCVPSMDDQRIAKDDIYALRPVEDGRHFTIVKAFYDVDTLEQKFEALGFEVSVDKFTETFFFLSGKSK